MPKLGRRNEIHHIDYLYPSSGSIVTRNAPFGTFNTPVQKTKIIGGQLVYSKEDGDYGTPRWGTSPDAQQTYSPHRGGSRASHNATPSKLSPLSQKPTNFNPNSLSMNGRNFYSSAQHDQHRSHLHSPDRMKNSQMNPHNVLPPISTPSIPEQIHNQFLPHDQDTDASDIRRRVENKINPPTRTSLTKYLPTDGTYLPLQPIKLSKAEELELRRLVREDLIGFNAAKLKDIYVELTGFDRNLTGCVSFDNLNFSLLRAQVCISPENLRLVASLFISTQHPAIGNSKHMVNYEKILSFISAAQGSQGPLVAEMQDHETDNSNSQNGSIVPSTAHTAVPSTAQTTVPSTAQTAVPSTAQTAVPSAAQSVLPDTSSNRTYCNPITQEDISPRSKRFPYGDGDNAKLLRMIEQAIVQSDEDLDFEHIYQMFRRFDREHRQMLSREQIKDLSTTCGIPLQNSLIDNILNKVESSNGQYSWIQYLEFLERVQPAKTGLRLSQSKRPADYAKHYPKPSSDWPKTTQQQPKQDKPDYDGQGKGDGQGIQQASLNKAPSPTHNKYKDNSISNVEAEIRRLEEAKKQLMEEEQRRTRGQEPWFQRFLKLAQSLYDNDIDITGYLPKDEVTRLIRLHNISLDLDFEEDAINRCVRNVAENENMVPIDPLLKILSLQHS